MNKKLILCLMMAMLATAMPAFVTAQRGKAKTVVERDPVPMPTVSTDTLIKHVMELSSETYRGRLAGSDGFDRAADYSGRVLARYGLKPMPSARFEVECNEVENCKFNAYRPGTKEKRVFTLGNEFCCAGMTGRGYVDAQMVFCGYGVDNGLFNEYRDVDVKGKIAVVLTSVPDWLPSTVVDRYRTLRDKARTAERHGAIGMLAINVSTSCMPNEPQGRVYCGELPHLATFPILQLTLDCGREIMDGEKQPLDYSIDQLASEHKVQSFSLLKKAEIDVNARYRPQAPTANVIGMLEGSDKFLSKEYIVVGSSLDGQGMQGETCLFPGADINASGVAAVLETARVLSNPNYRPKRSIIFVLFSAGEHQYMGSRAFVENFPKLRNVEAFVNAQNIGYGDSIVVLGDNKYPSLCDIIYERDSLAGRHDIVRSAERTNPRGDARAFDAMGIPSLVVTTHDGMHYNRVTNDIWETIDRRIITKATQIMTETVAELGEGLYQGRSLKSKSARIGE